ncbi:MAG: LTA synthase family protein [Candidatus Gastranaerophilales bacterium]|nr:LTA synthase family protein [Candidatus Gastranaerophilales bacterium]
MKEKFSLKFLFKIYLFWIFYFFLIRIYLIIDNQLFNIKLSTILKGFLIGIRYDIVVIGYFLGLIVVLFPLLDKHIISEKICKKIVIIYNSILTFIFVFFSIIEIYFFKEFGQRFNHKSVEYLIYPKEVLGNIWAYYPIIRIFIIAVILTFFISKLLNRFIQPSEYFKIGFIKKSSLWFIILVLMFIGCRSSFDHRPINISLAYFSNSQLLNEISNNGFFTFIYAVYDKIKNEVDFEKKYIYTNEIEAVKTIKKLLDNNKNEFVDTNNITRKITNSTEEKKYNVVIILEESLGAEYVGYLSKKYHNLTPNIDKIAEQGIICENAFSNGTRTSRGIEGVISSFPPIPGESTIKRSKSQNNFFTLSRVLKSKGYTNWFIYGGQAMFDNMRGFFNSNGVNNIVEEKDFISPIFESTWGVSDEDLFNKADEIFSQQTQPFFSLLLTTSNHMPFTFPENRIKKIIEDIPERDRLNAIKYTDYAIGEFLKKIKNRPYFKNTLFVIVADHGTRVFGKNIIPINKFHIPVIFYGPEILKNYPKKIKTVVGQIDIAPTILNILGINYTSTFFGRNIFKIPENEGFALVQYGELLGMITLDSLTVLYPGKKIKKVKNDYIKKYQLSPKNLNTKTIISDYFSLAWHYYINEKYIIEQY